MKFATYTFTNEALMKQALRHKSAATMARKASYERLEFLGDRVLGLAIAELVHAKFPREPEGKLAKRHAALVREETLATIAREQNLGKHIQVSELERRSGGQNKDSLLADVVESLLAVVYLETDFATAKALIHHLLTPFLSTVELQDAKSHLQEHLQGLSLPLPDYVVTNTQGRDHQKMFTLEARTELGTGIGEGASKQIAGQAAAQNLLEQLKVR